MRSFREQKYERVPIMPKDDEIRYSGHACYRGFFPKTSDSYFRWLKDVSFKKEANTAKKPRIRNDTLTFDSKF